MVRKVLLISNFNSDRRAWNGVPYEFVSTIAGFENATIVAPAAGPLRPSGSLFEPIRRDRGSIQTILREFSLMRRGGAFEPIALDQDYDVCFFVGQFARDLINLRRVRDWRKRSRIAIAFIIESWSSQLERDRAELALLDQFDHVFVMNAGSIPNLKRYTKAPVTFLSTATDCMRACPTPNSAERVIDVACIGRRIDTVHNRMLAVARERGWFYLYDVWGDLRAIDWAQAREANANVIKRSRYSIVWDPAAEKTKSASMGDERALTTRYFESAAGGSILLGSRSAAPEFAGHFDWPDVVIDIAPDGSDLEARLDELDADPARCAGIRRANVTNCLRRHDWGHRWRSILDTLDLAPTQALLDRLAALDARADVIERSGEAIGLHRRRPRSALHDARFAAPPPALPLTASSGG